MLCPYVVLGNKTFALVTRETPDEVVFIPLETLRVTRESPGPFHKKWVTCNCPHIVAADHLLKETERREFGGEDTVAVLQSNRLRYLMPEHYTGDHEVELFSTQGRFLRSVKLRPYFPITGQPSYVKETINMATATKKAATGGKTKEKTAAPEKTTKKAVAVKAAPAEAKTSGRKPGVGAYIRELLLEGKLDTAGILAKVASKFPESKAGPSDVSWNKGKLKRDGQLA